MPRNSGDDAGRTRHQSQNDSTAEQRTDEDAHEEGGHGPTRWFASTAVRIGLTLLGIVLLLFALGQAVGFPLLEFTVDALTSQTGRWLVVAFFAILLIGAAQRVTSVT